MTKKLSDLFDLPDLAHSAESNEALQTIKDNKETIAQVDAAIDKIDAVITDST